jgi:hypothetical protein
LLLGSPLTELRQADLLKSGIEAVGNTVQKFVANLFHRPREAKNGPGEDELVMSENALLPRMSGFEY